MKIYDFNGKKNISGARKILAENAFEKLESRCIYHRKRWLYG